MMIIQSVLVADPLKKKCLLAGKGIMAHQESEVFLQCAAHLQPGLLVLRQFTRIDLVVGEVNLQIIVI